MDVAVWDMNPGLTEEENLIGARHMDSAVNTVHVLCTNVTAPSPQGLNPPLRTASTIGQHGLDHPAVVIDFPSLECDCDYSNASSISSEGQRGSDAICRAGGQASWVLSVRGLVPGYSYKLHFKWSIEDEQLGAFDSVILTSTSSYVVRKPLRKELKNSLSGKNQNGTSVFDLIAHSRKLRMDVAVWDLYEVLTVEEALIGARHMDSAVNTVRVHCSDCSVPSSNCTVFESGDGDEWQYNFSAYNFSASENGSLPSVNATFNTHTFVFERPPQPKRGNGPVRCASISLPIFLGGGDSLGYPLFSWVVDALNIAGSNKVDVTVLPEYFAGHAPQVTLP
jgi:hypothetical protein